MDTTAAAPPGSPSSSHPMDAGAFPPGTILAGRYRIVALVGRGGMGEVYRADDLRLEQPVALKFLPAAHQQDPDARERLLAEVRNARTVADPNVCRVYDVGEVEGRTFLTMEYIDGEDLASLLRRIGRLPPAKALEVARQLCAGLAAAHDRGVLHRDLKPANVMIDGRGQARISDFGLAVEVDAAKSPVDFAGTVAYMAPERFLGKPATVQSDLYALGLILYETWTGKPAFRAATIGEWQRAHSDSTPTSPSVLVSEMEPAVERVILRCLDKDPATRPPSAAQVAAALPGGDPLAAALAAGETPSPELVAASGEEGTLPRRQAWLWLGACIFSLVVAVPVFSPRFLVNHLPLTRSSALQKERAREILLDLGYREARADSAWWIRTDAESLRRLAEQPEEERFQGDPGLPGPLIFCYRQSPRDLIAVGPWGRVNSQDPPPTLPGDATVELDPLGRLVGLRVVPAPSPVDGASSAAPDWGRLFAAARLEMGQFNPAEPAAWPTDASDARGAWESTSDAEERLRVEAAARYGRPIFLSVSTAGTTAPTSPSTSDTVRPILGAFFLLSWFAPIVILAVLARMNWRAGRGDRRGALRIALVTLAGRSALVNLARHWTLGGWHLLQILNHQGFAMLGALQFWVAYLALEPLVRRRWPRLLIAWTRLLSGRWRDPLVGRSLMIGVLGGLAMAFTNVAAAALMSLAGRSAPLPFYSDFSLDGGGAWFLAGPSLPLLGFEIVLYWIGVLLVARLALRSDTLALVVLGLVICGSIAMFMITATSMTPGLSLLAYVVPVSVIAGFVLWRSGLLAAAVTMTIAQAMILTPMTVDVSRSYAWRTGLLVVLILGLAFWGFKNVLGRQTAFPAGALDS